jgi:hypothetical protein
MGADPLYIGNYRKQRMMLASVLDQFNQKFAFRKIRHFIEHDEKNEAALRFFLKGIVTDENGAPHRIEDSPVFLDEMPAWYRGWKDLGDYDLIERGQLLIGHITMNVNFEKYELPGRLRVTFRESYLRICGLSPRYWEEEEKAFAFCMTKMIAMAFGGNFCFFTFDSMNNFVCVFEDEPEGFQPGMSLEEIMKLGSNKYIDQVRF